MRSLMYAILDIKSDIAFVILVIFWYSFNFIEAYYIAIKRIFRYLKEIIN